MEFHIQSVSVVTLNDLDKNDWYQTTKKYSKNHVQNDACCLAAITTSTILIIWDLFLLTWINFNFSMDK